MIDRLRLEVICKRWGGECEKGVSTVKEWSCLLEVREAYMSLNPLGAGRCSARNLQAFMEYALFRSHVLRR